MWEEAIKVESLIKNKERATRVFLVAGWLAVWQWKPIP